MLRKILLIIAIVLMASICFGANAQVTTTPFYIGALVDTDPGASGYGTIEIRPYMKNTEGYVKFTVTGGSATVDLQFRITSTGTWETEGQYTAGDCKRIYDNTQPGRWRAHVLDNNQGSGTTYFGFSWTDEKRISPGY